MDEPPRSEYLVARDGVEKAGGGFDAVPRKGQKFSVAVDAAISTHLVEPSTDETQDLERRVRRMTRGELIALWQRRWRRLPPKGLSRRLLEYNAAWQIQAEQFGDLDADTKRRLALLAQQAGQERRVAGVEDADRTACDPPPRHKRLSPGNRLIRQWGGHSHIVEVVEDGFTWQGKRFTSLSAIAREITGARWSGPRFFGLRAGSDQDHRAKSAMENASTSHRANPIASTRGEPNA